MTEKKGRKFLVLGLDEKNEFKKALEKWGSDLHSVITRDFPESSVEFLILPNSHDSMTKTFMFYCDVLNYDIILINTGLNLSTSNIIPETISKTRNAEANGFVVALYMECLKISPAAIFSRLACGFRNKTLISTFPDVSSNIEECFGIVKPLLLKAIKSMEENEQNKNKVLDSTTSDAEPKPNSSAKKELLKKEAIPPQQAYYAIRRPANIASDSEQSNDCSSTSSTQNVSLSITSLESFRPVNVEEAVQIIERLLKCYGVRAVVTVPVSKALGCVTADVIRSVEPYPSYDMAKVEGYACRSEDGNEPRMVSIYTSILERGQCTFIKQRCRLPRGADWVLEVGVKK